MNHILRVSAAQLATVIDGKTFQDKQKKNLQQVVKMLDEAGKRKSDLVLFGEYVNLHHRTWSDNKDEYVPDPIPGELTAIVAASAKKFRMNVALPLFGTYKGVLSSHVVLFDRSGRIVGCYQKTHPTVPEQAAGIKPGNELPVYKLDCATVGIIHSSFT